MAIANLPHHQFPLIGTGGGAGLAPSWPSSPPMSPVVTEDQGLYNMLFSRMRWHNPHYPISPVLNIPKFAKICVHRLNDTTVAVFVAINGKALVIEDGVDLFPSDTLVTQLRLLEGTK